MYYQHVQKKLLSERCFGNITLNLAKKLGLKTKNLKANIVKKWIEQIQANKTIAEWNVLFTNNPKQQQSTAIIFAQLLVKNVKKNNLLYIRLVV